MPDLKDARLIHLKGVLFLLLGLLCAGLLILDRPTWKTVALLSVCVWAFARLYYYAFYVIEHYIDPDFRFSGIGSFVRYLMQRSKFH